jgi:hypothetical protein
MSVEEIKVILGLVVYRQWCKEFMVKWRNEKRTKTLTTFFVTVGTG